jgi:HlyD family secretion protein
VEVTVSSGSLVQAGARLLTLEQPEAQLQTNLYIEPKEGKKIRPGMTVRISPSTIKVEEYGFLVGKVKTVSDVPVTRDALNRVLHNDALVETFMGKSAPIEVVAELTPDKTTPSGYKWSSSKGPPSQIQSGTVASGSVIVENKKPISYVIPIVKKAMGSS